jgi:hypothetical protein
MALSDLIRSGVRMADNLTADLQPLVVHSAWIGNDGFGGDLYAAPVSRPAIVEREQKMVTNAEGREVLAEHVITFLRPIENHGAPGRQEPIDPRDRFVLPDGTTGPVAAVSTFVDRTTGAGYYQQVFLGARKP